jgi:hypothetical protein
MDVVNIADYFNKAYRFGGPTQIAHLRRFLPDSDASQTDNHIVEAVLRLIYSPSDMPQGLWRGFAFLGGWAKGTHHAC